MAFSSFRGFGAASRPAAEFPVLPPEEEETLLRRIMGIGLGGLQWVGQSLDKPGAAVRGLIGGQGLGALANLIPFSDSVGLTDPSERIYSRDLLEKAGVLDKNTPGLDWGDVAGFVGDVATDPLSFVNPLGAGTKGFHVAKAAGIADQLPGLAKSKAFIDPSRSLGKRGMRSENTLGELIESAKRNAVDDVARQQIDEAVSGAAARMGYDLPGLLDQRLGGGFGFSAGPFAKSVALGGEARPVGRYGAALDRVGQSIAYGNPLSRAASAGFSRAVQNNVDPIVQQELRAFDPLKQRIEPEEILRSYDFRNELNSALGATDKANPKTILAARAFVENQLDFHKDLQPFLPPEAQKALAPLKTRIEDLRVRQEEIGLKNPEKRLKTQYEVGYFPRYATEGKPLDVPREDFLDVPGGTATVEKILQDGRLAPAKVLTKSEKSRAREILLKQGLSQDDLDLANDLAKQVREGTLKRSDMNIHEKYVFKSRAKALKEARAQKEPFKGKTTRENIIARDVFGMTDEQIQSARKLEQSIKETRGLKNSDPAKFIDPRKVKDLPGDAPELVARNATRQSLNNLKRSRELAGWAKSQGYRTPDNPLFPNHPIQDQRAYMVSQRGQLEFGNATQSALARSAKPFAEITQYQEGYINLNSAFNELGFEDITQAMEHFAKQTGGRFGATAEHVDAFVPRSLVDSLAKTFRRGKYKTPFDNTKEVNDFLDFFDRWINNLFKAGVTLAPAFHTRNQGTGLIQNVISGAYSFLTAPKYVRAAYQFSKGNPVRGLSNFKGIKRVFGEVSDEEATRKLLEAIDAYDLRGSRFDEIIENVEGRAVPRENAWEKLFPDLKSKPGAGPVGYLTPLMTLKEALGRPGLKGKWDAVRPGTAAGIGKGVVPEGVPLKAGETIEQNVVSKAQRQAGRVVEDVNRVSAVLGYMDNGMSLESAIRRAKATHVDYKNLSQFERSFMRRIAPFYSFTRGIAENTVKELMEHPGGKLAQTIRASNSGREGGGYVPDYIGEGAAIPLGEDKYLARLGLMHEAAFDPFVFRTTPGPEEGEPASLDVFQTPARTLQKFLSMTNPAIKTPIELATDKNLFTGRSHKDLYPYPLNPALMRGDFALLGNLALGASPASRAIRTVRKLEDERKSIPERALSALGGAGITDVYRGMEEAKELDAKRAAQELLKESPRIREHSTLYSPQDFRGDLTPTEKSLLRLQATHDKRDRERRKEAAKAD